MRTHLSIIIFIFVISITNAFAQKCKYDMEKKDPMTEEVVRRNEIKIKGYFIVSYYKKANEYRVELNVRFVGERNFIVSEGNVLELKLGSGEILKLYAAQQASPVSYVSSTQVMTIYGITHYCSEEEMKKLAEHGFKVAQTKLGDETITMALSKDKDIEDTAEKAKCMLAD